MNATPFLDPQSFSGELEKILAVLVNSKKGGNAWLSASQIATALRDSHGISIHWRRVDALLRANRQLAERRKRSRKWQYLALQAGTEMVGAAAKGILFIDPSKAIRATLSLHAFLGTLAGTAMICDPYVDGGTLDHLSACPKELRIRLLTKNVKDGGRVRALLAATRAEGRYLEVRVAASAPLHDRYIIDDTRMLILGTSLNGFGKKQSFVVEVGKDVRFIVSKAFDAAWLGGTAWV